MDNEALIVPKRHFDYNEAMNTKHIRFTHPYGQTPASVFEDLDWTHDHARELLALYGPCSIIVHHQQVIGIGRTLKESIADAERNLAPTSPEIDAIQYWLVERPPLARIVPKPQLRSLSV